MKTIFIALLFVLTLSANERIISLSPSITEIIYALEKGDSLVATSAYSLYPKEAQKLPVVGGYESPNIEKIIALSPTLVVAQSYNQTILDKLEHFNIKTLKLNLKTIDEIKKSINILAKEIGSTSIANKLTTNIDNALLQAPKNKNPHSVMIVYGLHEDLRNGIYIAGHNIFFEDIIKECGNTNAYTSDMASQPVLNYENVIALNPQQIIILHSHATEKHVDVDKALKAWYQLPTNASKNKQISIVDEDYLHIPSHRVAQTISRLCREMND
ncbi:MAG: helical backbone metal receptor [Sulfurimonas sp.]|uniref:ABC transporter substrate-binding protein n=1 Tax=Sulfurimonas sp. TaxID=2022749 RepID=UPI00262156E4|nr:helical backbone metal receptor [Sulfurimonas sp.]MCW8894601.1 helical backbone metal receptor [Sulfurimonas sp.]MCW8955044.1 helical backbone metal receptor [Sulfurimonas sp.]MCW9067449.1 helical backbone metal receptor [Sulfurimonas sp.]